MASICPTPLIFSLMFFLGDDTLVVSPFCLYDSICSTAWDFLLLATAGESSSSDEMAALQSDSLDKDTSS